MAPLAATRRLYGELRAAWREGAHYLWDPDWGAAFWKTTAYAPWPIWTWLNGRTWAQRQCERAGIGYTALDNGFRDCADPDRLQAICERLGPGPTLVRRVATLLDEPYTSRQATYDRRRLKRKGLITRVPGHHRYQLTPLGRRVAVLFTKTYGRVLAPGLTALDPQLPAELSARSPLARAWRCLDRSLDEFINDALAAA